MNLIQMAKLNMYANIQQFLGEHPNLINLAVYPVLIERFRVQYLALQTLSPEQLLKTAGATAQKEQKRELLISLSNKILRKVYVYSQVNEEKDLELEQLSTIKKYHLNQISALELIDQVKYLHQHLLPHLSKLENYAITPALMEEWLMLIQAFETIAHAPQYQRLEGALKTKTLASHFRDIDETLYLIDNLLWEIEESNPHLYDHYKDLRRLPRRIKKQENHVQE